MARILLVIVSVLALAGCGGGGGGGGGGGSDLGGVGGGGGDTGTESGSSGAGGSMPAVLGFANALAVRAVVVGDGAGSRLDGFTAPSPLIVEETSEAIRFTHEGDVTEIDLAAANVVRSPGSPLVVTGDDENALLETAEGTLLEHARFGGWVRPPADDGSSAGFIAFGAQGPGATALPTGSARYDGTSIGLATSGANSDFTTSDMRIDTDFATVTVRSSNTRQFGTGDAGSSLVATPGLDFTATGRVAGTGFAADGDGMRVDGAFHGPNAEEAAGVFAGTRVGSTYGGSFGAVRQ